MDSFYNLTFIRCFSLPTHVIRRIDFYNSFILITTTLALTLRLSGLY